MQSTGLGSSWSSLLTAKFSHHGNDEYEVLILNYSSILYIKFKNFKVLLRFWRPFRKQFTRCHLTVVCLSCLWRWCIVAK